MVDVYCFLRERRRDCGWWRVVLQSKDMVGCVDGRGGSRGEAGERKKVGRGWSWYFGDNIRKISEFCRWKIGGQSKSKKKTRLLENQV